MGEVNRMPYKQSTAQTGWNQEVDDADDSWLPHHNQSEEVYQWYKSSDSHKPFPEIHQRAQVFWAITTYTPLFGT